MKFKDLKTTLNGYPKHTAIRFSFDGKSESYLMTTFHEFTADHDRLLAEKAELVAALETVIEHEYMVSPSWSSAEARDAVMDIAQAALDKVKPPTSSTDDTQA